MKKLNYILILMMGLFLFNACEENTFIKDIENSDNIAGFTNSSKAVTQIADGTEYPVQVQMKVEGPSARELSGDFTVTIEADTEGIPADERAVEGTHYRLDQNEITLREDNNYLGVYNFTMLTQGITTPLAKSPKFKLKTTGVTGSGNVINSGKPLNVTLNYACPSNLQGTYSVSVTRNSDGATQVNPSEQIVKTGIGEYMTQSVEFFFPTGSRGTYLAQGLPFTDVCGTLTVPTHGLGDTYSNEVNGTQAGTVTGDAGTEGGATSFTLHYSVYFASGTVEYTNEYTYLGPLP